MNQLVAFYRQIEERNRPTCDEWEDTAIQWIDVFKRQLVCTRDSNTLMMKKKEYTICILTRKLNNKPEPPIPQELVSLTHLVFIYYLMVENAQKCMLLG